MNRTVTLVVVDPSGALLGQLPPFEVAAPWWQDVSEFGREDRPVLRLLHGDEPGPPGGHVTYLSETSDRPGGLLPAEVDLAPHPHRAAYAEAGGPTASVAWARAALDRPVTAHQRRTWNLSSIWRFDGSDGEPVAWLKQVPSFFAHEPAALALVAEVAPDLVPPVIAVGAEGRMLLPHVKGEDRYGAGPELCDRIAEAFHPAQTALAKSDLSEIKGRFDPKRVRNVAEPYFDKIDGLAALVDDLPARLAAADECGLPDTLVHGDLYPGNVRTDAAGHLTILDWGDCIVGNPAFDILRLTDDLDDPEPVLDAWAYRWAKSVPGSRPQRAVELLRPVAALRNAVAYADFLDRIEPSEWPYHARDVPESLAAALL
ncbi:phosphotransferase family protein [Paractinoplanes durhamensis]|uniref:Aminoglycoside phosphotransferase domain-containing protein n=1 Tax=Paractinoplanes durhamensis TaxID=113563 RepID=A0ABQ3Z967_9ACTN|nr:aminoglycoside phosphotransferase family protein [Actinoplanes durhamensis]GIE06360.1 hypothetical protein Adu01nite_77100 [Actinoplanes durhamensis]